MSPALRCCSAIALVLLGLARTAHSFDAEEAAALGETHFRQLHGFDALEAYEVHGAERPAGFVVARRWKEGRAKLLIDIEKPTEYRRFALLLLQNLTRSDDLFLYFPRGPRVPAEWWRKVRRFNATDLQGRSWFGLFPLGGFRPMAEGELAYTHLGEVEIEGEPCTLVEGRPTHPGLAFDRVELAVSRTSGFALQSRYFEGGRETQQVTISPQDLRELQGRVLPVRRRVVSFPRGEVHEILLRNVIVDAELPDHLFTRTSLLFQNFPKF